MPNRLKRYKLGAGAGVTTLASSGKLVIGDSTPTTTSTSMYGVAADFSGNLYIADSAEHTIYKSSEGGRIRVFAGSVGNAGHVDGAAATARFSTPKGVAVDRSGNVYVADYGNGVIRKIDRNGTVGTLATGFSSPFGVAVAPNGDVYVTDDADHVVYIVFGRGAKQVLAGSPGTSGDVAGVVAGVRVRGATARFDTPRGVAVDGSGNVYVADSGNTKIKKIYTDGWVVRWSGVATPGNVLGTANNARYTDLFYMAVDRRGDLFVVDKVATNNRVKRVDRNGTASTVTLADAANVLGIAVSPNDNLFIIQSAGTVADISSSSSSTSSSSSGSSSSTEVSVSSSSSSSSTEVSVSSSSSSSSTEVSVSSSSTESSSSSSTESSSSSSTESSSST